MYTNARFVFALLLLVSSTIAEQTEDAPCKGACQKRVKCSDEETVAWATDGESCSVFRNACQLENANCNRQENCQKELTSVDKEECQKLCPQICPALYAPVCAEYNGANKDFSNQCELRAHICQTGQVWNLHGYGSC